MKEAADLMTHLEIFKFVFMPVVYCKILQLINIVSKMLQARNIDLRKASDLLKTALRAIQSYRENYVSVKDEAKIMRKRGVSRANFQ